MHRLLYPVLTFTRLRKYGRACGETILLPWYLPDCPLSSRLFIFPHNPLSYPFPCLLSP